MSSQDNLQQAEQKLFGNIDYWERHDCYQWAKHLNQVLQDNHLRSELRIIEDSDDKIVAEISLRERAFSSSPPDTENKGAIRIMFDGRNEENQNEASALKYGHVEIESLESSDNAQSGHFLGQYHFKEGAFLSTHSPRDDYSDETPENYEGSSTIEKDISRASLIAFNDQLSQKARDNLRATLDKDISNTNRRYGVSAREHFVQSTLVLNRTPADTLLEKDTNSAPKAEIDLPNHP